jgi:hypothetical protein
MSGQDISIFLASSSSKTSSDCPLTSFASAPFATINETAVLIFLVMDESDEGGHGRVLSEVVRETTGVWERNEMDATERRGGDVGQRRMWKSRRCPRLSCWTGKE